MILALAIAVLCQLLAMPEASGSAELRVLFVGNSLTSANDLPAMLGEVARTSGWKGSVSCEQVTRGNFSLQDHWEQGDALQAIRRGGWTHVVLQQGPSSLLESRQLLREYTRRFANEIHAQRARVVLYGVWPPRARLSYQRAVTEAYSLAASDVGGLVVPVGDGWAAARRKIPTLPLYATDDFHPSPAGTYLAALMLFEALTGERPASDARLPAVVERMRLGSGQVEAIREAAARVRAQASAPLRTMAITIDDLPTASVLGEDIARAERTTRDLLGAIRRADVPAIGFVNERKLHSEGKLDARRIALLRQWIDAGLELGNHTFSHVDLHRADVETFTQEVLRGEQVTRRLLGESKAHPKYFRHPFLHTGRSLEVRTAVESFLSRTGYRIAPVTIDNYDYLFAAAYDRANAAGNSGRARRIRDEYVRYMESVVAYYEAQSVAIAGREIAQTLLIHANALNGAMLETVVERLRRRGYQFVPLEEALKDPAYGSKDKYVGAGGISWLHRWALTDGKSGAIFSGEPEAPQWVRRAAEER